MTTERDPRTRIVLSWLHEDAHEDAERLLLRALDEVDTTPQRRPWSARRFTDMNTYAKLAIAAAAVLVVAFAGFQLLPRKQHARCATNGDALAYREPDSRAEPICRCTYGSARARPLRLDLERSADLARGARGLERRGGRRRRSQRKGPTLAGASGTTPVTHVYTDACHSEGALEPVDGTLQGLVDALDAQVSTDATITDVTLGGRPAKRVDLAPSPGAHDASCRNGAEGPLQIWADPGETGFFAWYPGARGPCMSSRSTASSSSSPVSSGRRLRRATSLSSKKSSRPRSSARSRRREVASYVAHESQKRPAAERATGRFGWPQLPDWGLLQDRVFSGGQPTLQPGSPASRGLPRPGSARSDYIRPVAANQRISARC